MNRAFVSARFPCPKWGLGSALVLFLSLAARIADARESAGKPTSHWAYAPLRAVVPPPVRDVGWPRTPIDRFVLARLELEGLSPAPEADRFTRLRRLYLDLTGLPPRPDELDAFSVDLSPDAWDRAVDQLLASPRFGEHWARNWMDVVRYAESVTLRGLVFKEAWRYRDYLIQSFNLDVPYDRLILEQLAGDLLPASDWREASRQIVATTFLALGNTNLEEQDKQQLEMDVVDEQLDTMGRAFLGQTLGCARCHDHKYDPIPTRDYYGLAGIFKNSRSLKHANVSEWIERPLPLDASTEEALTNREQRLRELRGLLQCYRQAVAAETTPGTSAPDPASSAGRLAAELRQLEDSRRQLEESGPKRPFAMSVIEEARIADLPIHKRGSVHSLGEIVPRGFLQQIHGPVARLPGSRESGRLELARWVAHPANPLTARVFVNRVWYWLLGEGLVRSVDNFGSTGDAASHPELLDHLARRFVEEDWSVKRLVRSIVRSRVYQLSEDAPTRRDVENRLLSHAHRRRLRAEQLRDAMLSASGALCLDGGGLTFSPQLSADYGFVFPAPLRSVYAPVFRNALPEMLECFDFPPPMMVSGRREASMIPGQALFLLNHPFTAEQADRVAQRLLKEVPGDDSARLRHCYLALLGREPSRRERELLVEHLRAAASARVGWTEVVHALFASIDFRYLH